MLNVPEEYRQQVWELVDRRRWFYSGMFRPFAKRPPGWWWSLDRPGDVRKSIKIAARNVFICAGLIMGGGLWADAIKLERTTTYIYWQNNTVFGAIDVSRVGLEGVRNYDLRRRRILPLSYSAKPPENSGTGKTTIRAIFLPDLHMALTLCGWTVLAISVWFFPATVGLWTQIRKGLPQFARAPRTIIAASFLESHRLIYVALFFVLCLAVETTLRMTVWPSAHYYWVVGLGQFVLLAFTLAWWIGPLRSDYTRQLVRSRKHAHRIIVMYVVALPFLTVASLWSFYVILTSPYS